MSRFVAPPFSACLGLGAVNRVVLGTRGVEALLLALRPHSVGPLCGGDDCSF